MRVRAVLVSLLLFAAGCLWRSYGRVLEIHLEVLQSMASKMCQLTPGPPPVSESMGEFSYPAKRARELQRQFTSRSERPSYQEFSRVLDSYERLVRLFDRLRVSQETWELANARVCAGSRAIAQEANVTREALAREG